MKNRFFIACVVALFQVATMSAQTDATSYIKNPSFEEGTADWVHKSMGTQENNVFSIKDGKVYMEKWTGRGGAVGSGGVSQVLQNLIPGNYELSAAAQNIQEDTPTKEQSGAWIFAGDKRTKVTVRDTYTVAFTYVSGKITIGFEAVDASGNWIAVDNFRLTLVSQNLTNELLAAIEEAVTLYADGSGKQAAQLLAAIEVARAAADKGDNAEGDEQAQAIIALEKAVDIYRRANASEDNPLDMTSSIANPSFEKDGLTDWSSTGMGTQGNSVFSIKDGNTYVERWTGRGGHVGDAKLFQILSNMPPGRYQLKVAAQNIQEDTPKAEQTGAWIYANFHKTPVGIRQDYTLDFVSVSDQMEIGFEAQSATGNWLAVDNFRLFYLSDDFDLIRAEYLSLIAQAEELLALKTNTVAHNALQEAMERAKALQEQTDTEGWPQAARELQIAYQTAAVSQKIFEKLKQAIDEAQAELDGSESESKAVYQTAVDEARDIYNDDATTDAMAEAAIVAMAEASFAFRVENGSGEVPTVTTDMRFVRGATWAFGRSTVQGSNIVEEGFCWSENPDPRVTDNRTTEYLNQAGKIYWLRNLKPATVYYMRAYAITKDYAVGYGDVIKFVTVPKGTIGWWYNNGGDEETNARLNYAIGTAVDYYWNNLSSIHGMGLSVSYSPGTPTADCSYGGSMRVGASSSYQQVGTIMHEALHAIGVGQHGNWWSGDYRTNGVWMGDRVTEALRFWDNSATAVLSGDDMHLWPYGCNGAHEDTHSDNLYCMMGSLAQALNEDGLPGSGEIGYALPYYAFNHEDGVKYYIKNEDEARGLYTSYLVETADHKLKWTEMTAEEARDNDAAAWYLTFTPGNQYYQLRNAASNYYITYASGFKTVKRTTPASADNLHLMRGRVDVTAGNAKFRGYYVIHPESSSNPPVLAANTNGQTTSASFSIANTSTTQRWLILSAEDMDEFENGAANAVRNELAELIAQLRKLAETPHTEEVEGADQILTDELDAIETAKGTVNDKDGLMELVTRARKAGFTFLESVAASDLEQPFDLTYMLQNPDFDTDATTGWTSTNGAPGYGAKAAEFYERTFNFYQNLTNLPLGVYELRVQAFQRPGSYGSVLAPYTKGTAKVTSSLYIGSATAPVKHICDDRQPKALYTGDGYDQQLADGTYIPNTMTGASKYFAKGLYDNSVAMENTTSGASLKVGLRCTSAPSYYWTMFDHFRLYFYGQNRTLTGVDEIVVQDKSADSQLSDGELSDAEVIYDLTGQRVRKAVKGLYIVSGKKVLIK